MTNITYTPKKSRLFWHTLQKSLIILYCLIVLPEIFFGVEREFDHFFYQVIHFHVGEVIYN